MTKTGRKTNTMSAFLNQFKRIPPATLVLIALNVIAYIVLPFIPDGAKIYESWVLSAESLIKGDYYTLITSMFLHGGLMHIVCNMVSLYYLGVMCEKIYGTFRYILLYFLSGIIGGLAFCAVNYAAGDPGVSAVGASGAIFGLFGAYGWILLKEHKFATVLGQPTSKADLQAYGAILLANLAIGFAPGSGIANEAHIGGMIAGFVIGMLFYGTLRQVRAAGRMVGAAAKSFAPKNTPSFVNRQNSRNAATRTPNAGSGSQTSYTQPAAGANANNPFADAGRESTQKRQQHQTKLAGNSWENSASQAKAPSQTSSTTSGGYSIHSGKDEGRAGQYDPYHRNR